MGLSLLISSPRRGCRPQRSSECFGQMALIGKPDLDRDIREWDVGGS